jgi:hypothetical protein
MIAMGMVQPAVDEIVDMVAMRHLLMSTVWTVRMWAAKLRRAFHGVCGVDRDDVFVHVIPMHMVQMAVVKIIDMALVANRGWRGVAPCMRPLARLLSQKERLRCEIGAFI